MDIQVKLNDGRTMVVDALEEFKRCKNDPLYFIDNYCYIVDPIKGELPFKTFDYQKRIVHDFQTYQFNIVKKPRQMGLSWITACYGLWLINFHNDKTVLIISIRDHEAMEFKDKARYTYDKMPDFLRVEADDRSKHGLNLDNGSSFLSLPQTRTAGRSKALSLLILDEVAFQEFAEDLWASAWPTLSTGGNAILISTTNGMGNLYHRVFVEAIEETNDFNPIAIKWSEFPGRDDVWLLKQKRQLGDKRFRSEILCEFLGSGDTVISGDALSKLRANQLDPLYKYKMPMESAIIKVLFEEMSGQIPGLWAWEGPIPGERYILAADVATGNEQDSSAFQVVKISDNSQVCEYKNKSVASQDYAKIIKLIARYYNEAYVVIESNSWGLAAFEKVYRDEKDPYRNMYITKRGKASWETTGKTRPRIIDSLINSIEREEYKIVSPRLIAELETFVWRGNKPQATKGYHDDLVISFAILTFIRPKLSSFVPMGLTSSRDVKAFRYDDEALIQIEKEDIDKPSTMFSEDDDEMYDERGNMTQKAMYKWLSK